MEEDPRMVRHPHHCWVEVSEISPNSSGDIGVSASLVLHGTPPFQVYYRSQRNTEAPKDSVKTFPTARGELTVQPDRSGHYTFKVYQISAVTNGGTSITFPAEGAILRIFHLMGQNYLPRACCT